MDIINLPFEKPLLLDIKGEIVEIIPFKTQEFGNIKFGIKAPRSLKVNREEIYQALKDKAAQDSE